MFSLNIILDAYKQLYVCEKGELPLYNLIMKPTWWKISFTNLLAEALKEFLNCGTQHSASQLYSIYEKLTQSQKWGIWKYLKKITGTSSRQIQNYFHNTWCKQFYENVYNQKEKILELIQKYLYHENRNYQVMQEFMSQHGQQFKKNQVQQVVWLLSKRNDAKTTPIQAKSQQPLQPSIDSPLNISLSSDNFADFILYY